MIHVRPMVRHAVEMQGLAVLRATRFLITALVGFALVIGLLTAGVVVSVHRLDDVAARQVAQIREREYQITLAERLRWTGTALAANARGYTIDGDSELQRQVRQAEAEHERIVASLDARVLDREDAVLVDEIQRATALYRAARQQVSVIRTLGPHAVQDWVRTQLLARERALESALNAFVDAIETHIQDVYAAAALERHDLRRNIHVMLGAAFAASLAVAVMFAMLLARTYRTTARELERSRQEAIATRDQLMGIVAHDLRNPLSAIALRSALMQEQREIEPLHQHARAISDVAARMGNLIRSMLDVASLEAGAFSVTRTSCEIDRLVRATIDTLGTIATAKGIALEAHVEPRDLRAEVDQERISQVLGNLVGNALKFTGNGGKIVISAAAREREVAFAVSDTGPGIPPEHLPHVFDRFWKEDRSSTTGRGLGLFIARGIVEAHGGKIWAESELGHGTTFHFVVPAS